MSKRLKYLSEKFSEQIWNKASQDTGMVTLKDLNISNKEELFQKFIETDPTPNNRYLQWLIECYLGKSKNNWETGFLLEDFSQAKETLEAFSIYSRRLKINEKKRHIRKFTPITSSRYWSIQKFS